MTHKAFIWLVYHAKNSDHRHIKDIKALANIAYYQIEYNTEISATYLHAVCFEEYRL